MATRAEGGQGTQAQENKPRRGWMRGAARESGLAGEGKETAHGGARSGARVAARGRRCVERREGGARGTFSSRQIVVARKSSKKPRAT